MSKSFKARSPQHSPIQSTKASNKQRTRKPLQYKVQNGLRALKNFRKASSKFPIVARKKISLEWRTGPSESFVLHTNQNYSSRHNVQLGSLDERVRFK